jgi:putative endonuclease
MSRVSDRTYFVYVLWSQSARRFYIGVSEDPSVRLAQHNSEAGKHWTKRYRPWTLIHSERHASYAEARRRELRLKAQKGGAGFFAMTGLNPSDFPRRS